MKISELTEYFDIIAPGSRSADWDNDGVMIDCGNDIKKMVIALDVTSDTVDFAIDNKANLIISHHPLLFRPVKRIAGDAVSNSIKRLIKNDISVLSYHTRMDASDMGINQYILNSLGLKNIIPFGLDQNDFTGRIGDFEAPVTVDKLCDMLKKLFGCSVVTYSGNDCRLSRIAVVSGGGSEYTDAAKNLGADAFISGEFKHHQYINAMETGFPIISIDHYHCENVFVKLVHEILAKRFPELEILPYLGRAPFVTVL